MEKRENNHCVMKRYKCSPVSWERGSHVNIRPQVEGVSLFLLLFFSFAFMRKSSVQLSTTQLFLSPVSPFGTADLLELLH